MVVIELWRDQRQSLEVYTKVVHAVSVSSDARPRASPDLDVRLRVPSRRLWFVLSLELDA